jgi:4-hydroxy-tetrahydrodipicolinate synthase
MSHTEIRDHLTGPIASIRTPFKKNGEMDFDGLRRYLDFVIDAGSKTVLLTHGDSLYSILNEQEIAEITKITVDHTANRAMVCAATGMWPTRQTVAFAEYCVETGVDILMALPPDWGGSLTTESIVTYFGTVGKILPVMLVTNFLIPRGADRGIDVVEAVRDRVPEVAAVKDDFCGEFGRRLSMAVHDSWAVFTGGQKQNHIAVHHLGCDGYLSSFITFKPEIAHSYWGFIQSGNIDEASRIIREYDIPLFSHLKSIAGGFDAGFHGIYELIGLYNRWRRPPYHSLTDPQMDELESMCETLGIL